MKHIHIVFAPLFFALNLTPSALANDNFGNAYSAALGPVELSDSGDSATNGLEIEAGNNSNATIKLSTPISEFGAANILLSAPFDKDAAETNFSNFDAFKDATSVTLSVQYQNWKPATATGESIASKFQALCSAETRRYIELDECWNLTELGAGHRRLVEEIRKLETSLTSVENSADRDRLNGLKNISSNWSNLEQAVLEGPDRVWLIQYGVTTEYGQKEFEYIESNSLEYNDQNENPWSIAANFAFGRAFEKSAESAFWAANIEYKYVEAYSPGDSETRCNADPVDENTFLSCVNGPIGSPTKEKVNMASANYRLPISSFSTLPFVSKIAVSPKVTYDIDKEDFLLSLPIYLVQGSEKGLSAGIKIEWNETEDDTEYSLFIGQRFALF